MKFYDKFIVIKKDDLNKYVHKSIAAGLDDVLLEIEEGRKQDGKFPTPFYYVVNTDEPYADEVARLIETHERRKAVKAATERSIKKNKSTLDRLSDS